MKRWSLLLLLLAVLCLSSEPRAALGNDATVRRVADATTELDVQEARRLLSKIKGDAPAVRFEHARLAVYVGDCDAALAILSSSTFAEAPEANALAEVAKNCARATAGSLIIEDAARGVWLRLQDQSDRVLVPFIVDVAARARDVIGRDLGVQLPRPLRIDLVRDLFSLAAVTGLPLEAAETTGTVAVARWGRVTMISPRATALGYPWQDTLAHEITHLALSRATRDRAPLWLQEGIAKREETRWRPPRPFDDTPAADDLALRALLEGRSVGIDRLGPSIAMLPTPEAATIAFAEVTSFISYFIRDQGEAALRLLLTDLKGLGLESADAALRSVTGYDLTVWKERWKRQLLALNTPGKSAAPQVAEVLRGRRAATQAGARELLRHVRLGDLLMGREHFRAALGPLEAAVGEADKEPAVRFRAARAALGAGESARAFESLGGLDNIHGPHGGWFALEGRKLREQRDAAADGRFRLGLSLDPLAEAVACEGYFASRRAEKSASNTPEARVPADPAMVELCREARRLSRD
jgi:hypothetical protein